MATEDILADALDIYVAMVDDDSLLAQADADAMLRFAHTRFGERISKILKAATYNAVGIAAGITNSATGVGSGFHSIASAQGSIAESALQASRAASSNKDWLGYLTAHQDFYEAVKSMREAGDSAAWWSNLSFRGRCVSVSLVLAQVCYDVYRYQKEELDKVGFLDSVMSTVVGAFASFKFALAGSNLMLALFGCSSSLAIGSTIVVAGACGIGASWFSRRCINAMINAWFGDGKRRAVERAYEALQLRPDATAQQVRAQYLKLALQHHPDKPSGNQQEFIKISAAYELINNLQTAYQTQATPEQTASTPPTRSLSLEEGFENTDESQTQLPQVTTQQTVTQPPTVPLAAAHAHQDHANEAQTQLPQVCTIGEVSSELSDSASVWSLISSTSQRSQDVQYYIEEYPNMEKKYIKMLVRGDKLQEKGQLQQALFYFEEVCAKYPYCDDAANNKSMILRQLQAKQLPNRCYVPMTMFWTSTSATAEVTALKPGDKVLDVRGQVLEVEDAVIHEEELRKLAQLKTRTSSITVTADHRIVVPAEDGSMAEKPADELLQGDLVYCADKPVALEKVSHHWMKTKVVEVKFKPDNPVQTFIAPKWGVLTKGAQDAIGTDDGF